MKLELAGRSSLFRPYTPGRNFRAKVVFAFYGTTGHPAQHIDLSGVGERVGYGALKQLFCWIAERRIGSKIVVKGLNSAEESLNFLLR